MSNENVVFLCLFRIVLMYQYQDFLKFNGQHTMQDESMVGKIILTMILS